MTVESVIDLLISRGLIDYSQREEYIAAAYGS